MNRGKKAGINMAKALVEQINLMYQSNTASNFIKGFIETFYTELRNNEHLRNPPGKGMKPFLIEDVFKDQINKEDNI